MDRRLLETARAFCAGVESPKASISLKVLEALLASVGNSTAQIAKEAGCSRG